MDKCPYTTCTDVYSWAVAVTPAAHDDEICF